MNNLKTPLESLGTSLKDNEQKEIFTACLYWEDASSQDLPYNGGEWKYKKDKAILKRFGRSGKHFQLDKASGIFGDNAWWPCSVVHRDNSGDDSYIVRIFQADWRTQTKWTKSGTPRFLTEFPRSSIRYFHVPYSSPLHMKEAFRHMIEIPSNIFPQQWVNRRKKLGKFDVGDKVERLFRSGKIVKGYGNGKYDISYENGDLEKNVDEVKIRWTDAALSTVSTHPYA